MKKSNMVTSQLAHIKEELLQIINGDLGPYEENRHLRGSYLSYRVGDLFVAIGKEYAYGIRFKMDFDERIAVIKFIVKFIESMRNEMKSMEMEKIYCLSEGSERQRLEGVNRHSIEIIEVVLGHLMNDLSLISGYVVSSNVYYSSVMFNLYFPYYEDLAFAVGDLIMSLGHGCASMSLGYGCADMLPNNTPWKTNLIIIYDFVIDILESLYNMIRLD
jgi:hypothetical protein